MESLDTWIREKIRADIIMVQLKTPKCRPIPPAISSSNFKVPGLSDGSFVVAISFENTLGCVSSPERFVAAARPN